MLYALILAGGKGSRLYPLSREENPKQFLNVINGKSFIRNTVDRVESFIDKKNIFVVTNKEYKGKIQSELPELDEKNIFAEPENKETATCIGLSAIKLLKKDKDAVMIVLPSDHYIKEEDKFIETIMNASEMANRRRGIITIGVNPTRAETGYGYIKTGIKINSSIETYKVERFVEKPNVEVAMDFLRRGTYLWNSGIFIMRADILLREMEKYLPKLYKNIMEIYLHLGEESEDEVIKNQYRTIEGISIDFGIMQKTRKAFVIKCDFQWDDIGTFASLNRYINEENKDNGTVYMEDSENCIIYGKEKLIIGFGLKDIIAIDSGDVILIMNKNKDQDIKYLVDRLKNKKEFKKYI